ncbi:sushi, von Willebrand factor type A, EGF and pentraxin domain-containing protein 1-like [Diadema antillarum]|uniref:sushi, von Willebrand factor type A, EGF and pentraxin domain-containing protein 1-like n=1 Tax=Diadema antillarum TaxID=105358 RepID=UPI003A8A1EBD
MMLSTIGDDPTDLVIVLDSSGSVGVTDYGRSVEFVDKASLILPIQPAKTRVAIVSYSSCNKIHTYVDYIRSPVGKHKCILDQDIHSTVRVIMLSTDGASNDGGPPLDTAQGLKDQGITIFSIGLGSGINKAELEAIATSVEDHLFYLDNLGDVSRFGEVIKSGCPRGTYKSTRGNIACDSCPTHSSTNSTGSLSPADCECDTGYEGTSNDTCEAVQCPVRSLNQIGVSMISSACPNTYSNTSCEFQCQDGYRPSGGSNSSRCTEKGDWSHDFLQCERITCPALTPPPNADVTCSPPNDNRLGTTCNITCHYGYDEHDQGTVECEPQGDTNGEWSRQDWKCQTESAERENLPVFL